MDEMMQGLREALYQELKALQKIEPEALLESRYQRFRQIGADRIQSESMMK